MTARALSLTAMVILLAAPPRATGAANPSAATPAPTGSTPATALLAGEPTVGADYADARRIAANRRVPVLLEFYADW